MTPQQWIGQSTFLTCSSPFFRISSEPCPQWTQSLLLWMRLCLSNVLCNLVPFVQFKKREKHPWKKVTFVTKSNTSPCVFFTFLKLYKWYQIAKRITYRAMGLNGLGYCFTSRGSQLTPSWDHWNFKFGSPSKS